MPSRVTTLMILLMLALVLMGCPSDGVGGGDEGQGEGTGEAAGEGEAEGGGEGLGEGQTEGEGEGEEEPAFFPDPNLRNAIHEALDIPVALSIYPSDLASLEQLGARSAGITDLTGLEHCTSFDALDLGRNAISDLGPLAGLTNLTDLDLHSNTISDLGPLSRLTNLTRLDLAGNTISDVGLLLENDGLGEGDHVDLRNNPLNEQACLDVVVLLGWGVSVEHECE